MAETQQTLESLLVDEREINREILHELLSDYVRIGKQSGELIPEKKVRRPHGKKESPHNSPVPTRSM